MKSYLNLTFSLFLGCIACSCSNNKDLYSPQEINSNFEAFNTSAELNVTVPTGKVAVVRIGNDTLSVTDESKSVLVPKSIQPTVEYFDNTSSKADNYNPLTTNKDSFWQVIAFEDTKNGDNDFNDLIIHVKYTLDSKKVMAMYIHPIAYGATKNIDLYYEIHQGNSDKILAQGSVLNTRKNLFKDNTSGFINTASYDRHYNGYTASLENVATNVNSLSKVSVVWYIVVDNGTKIYALNKDLVSKVDMFNATNGYPYSLVLSGVNSTGYKQDVKGQSTPVGFDWFRYPLEKTSIKDCYNMDGWLKSDGEALQHYMSHSEKTFDVTATNNVSGQRIYEVSKPFLPVNSWQ